MVNWTRDTRAFGQIPDSEYKGSTSSLLQRLEIDSKSFQLGHTKIFFRAGVLGQLELRRSRQMAQCSTYIQSRFKGYIQRLSYKVCTDSKSQQNNNLMINKSVKLPKCME